MGKRTVNGLYCKIKRLIIFKKSKERLCLNLVGDFNEKIFKSNVWQ